MLPCLGSDKTDTPSVVGAGFIWQRRCQKNDRLFVRIDMKNQSSILAATNFHAALMKRKPPPLPLWEFRMAMRPMIKKTEEITVITRAVHLPIFSKQDLMHAGAPRWTHGHSTAYL